MKFLKGKIQVPAIMIVDSFVDLSLFNCGKPHTLNRAAIIPLEEYAELLQDAERFEKLAMLKPLAEVIRQREIAIMDEAQIDKKLL